MQNKKNKFFCYIVYKYEALEIVYKIFILANILLRLLVNAFKKIGHKFHQVKIMLNYKYSSFFFHFLCLKNLY